MKGTKKWANKCKMKYEFEYFLDVTNRLSNKTVNKEFFDDCRKLHLGLIKKKDFSQKYEALQIALKDNGADAFFNPDS